ncbi:hypothetical protein B9Q08_00055 [Candidatus Marsarchaeota G2 archaeon ECH_B_SAG-M15]|uniref:Uncharacterized protein n=1 Tax=Candidatus Marsarchaeota G2 archaeon ECH_B_SAG-M15 TaxID=1978162 RepID=A0A2R6B2Z5_9ARCH|nr:MAG: hypothetical protein B9Q08_00055 [Candidatus Marsarchaeota G2 archaeon ECH_B_SAG-M15]
MIEAISLMGGLEYSGSTKEDEIILKRQSTSQITSIFGFTGLRIMDYQLKSLVFSHLSGSPRCYGHCEQTAGLRVIREDGDGMVGCYVCPSGYVSRIVRYSIKRDEEWFTSYLKELLGAQLDIKPQDVRVATRYNWDLGLGGEKHEAVLKEHYWVQSYRRTKSDDPNRQAVFMCSQCDSLFQQPASSKNTLCPACAPRNQA